MTPEQRADLGITPEQARQILKKSTGKEKARATCLMLLTALTPLLLSQGAARAAAEAKAQPLASRRQLPPPARASRKADEGGEGDKGSHAIPPARVDTLSRPRHRARPCAPFRRPAPLFARFALCRRLDLSEGTRGTR